MMTNKSKAKGGAWERDVSTFLTKLYSAPFMRVPNSGAYTGGMNAHRRDVMSEGQVRHMKGDIVPPDNWYHFNCECKNYASFPFHRLLYNASIPQLEEWFTQIMAASDPDDINILFMKITRIGKFVAFEASQSFKTTRHIRYVDDNNVAWKITEFDDFFKLNFAAFERVHGS